MSDSHIFINSRTPGYVQVTVDRASTVIEALFDNSYSENGGMTSREPVLTCSESDAVSFREKSLVEIPGEDRLRVAAPPMLDGLGMAEVLLEEYYDE